MAATIVTLEDLQDFKIELLEAIQELLQKNHSGPSKKWIKSHEVRKILTISPGTLQNLRINGTLPFTKIGGVIYYDYEDIQNMLVKHKQTSPFP